MNNTTTLYDRLSTEFFSFTDGVRLLFLTDRKHGKNSRDRAKFHKLISYSREDFFKKAELLKNIGDSIYPDGYRIYSSLNDRNIRKAVYIFKTKMLAADFQNDESFYVDFYNRWVSSLMKPQARNSRLFLLDIDNPNELTKIKRQLSNITRSYSVHKTPNGYHIYSQPFNVKLLPNVEIKKDGLMLIYWKQLSYC